MKIKTMLVYGIAYTVSDTLPPMRQLLKEFKGSNQVEVGTHGDSAFPLYYVGWWKAESDRGSPRPVDTQEFDSEVADKLKDFCSTHGLPYRDPRFWLLCWSE